MGTRRDDRMLTAEDRCQMQVDHVPIPSSAVQRARWLAELASALDEALKLASELGLAGMTSKEADEVWARLISARAQVQGLRFARPDDRPGDASAAATDLPIW